jgi:iron complex outermembrane receptor protein
MNKLWLSYTAGLALMLGGLSVHAAEPDFQFDIPAESLSQALTDFSQASSQQIIFSEDLLKGRHSTGLHGRYTSAQAIAALLAGTDLKVQPNTSGVLMVQSKNVRAALDGAAETDGSQSTAGLETVVVSAQKRAEDAQNVPISMTTLSRKDLDIFRVQNLQDVSRLAPGLLVSAFSNDSPTIAIRGANNTFSMIGVNKPISVVVDDVFVPRSTGAVFKLFDLDSLSVLEGPQGTLFGRNVSGGAIVIETKKPTLGDFDATGEITTGNLGDIELNALTNIPLNDKTAVNFSTSFQHRDGWGTDRLTGRKQDDINSQNYRGNLLVDATPDLTILVSADYSYDWNQGRTLSSTSLGNDGNPRTSELGVNEHFNRALGGGSVKINWDAPFGGELTSISAYRRTQSGELYSGVAANYSFLTTGSQSITTDNDQLGTFTQEIRYASPKWDWGDFVTGVYYLNEDGYRQLLTNGLAAKTGVLASSTLVDQYEHTNSYAGFFDGTVHILPTLDISAGARYTVDQKTASQKYTDNVTASKSYAALDQKAQYSKLTPRAVLTWRPMEQALAYASVTKGFTSGGFDADASTLVAFRQGFQPETVTNYEAGIKTQWFDDTVRLNATLFDMQYHNKQELLQNSITGILDIFNAASAISNGFELLGAYKPLDWLELSANYAKLNAKYESFQIGTVNNTGHHLASSPSSKYNLSAEVNYPVEPGYLIGSFNYAWTDTYNTGAAADPRLQIPSYGLVNLNVGYETDDHRYRVTVWSKNLADTKYVLTNSTQVITGTYLGEPRTFGVTLGANL